jgi:hypothetical protein
MITTTGDDQHLYSWHCQPYNDEWDESEPTIVFVGLKPTTFFEESDLLSKYIFMAGVHGYYSMTVVHLYAQRADRIKDLNLAPPTLTAALNHDHVANEINRASLVVCCFGTKVPPPFDITKIKTSGELMSYGNARSPFRVKASELELQPWPDVDGFGVPVGLQTERYRWLLSERDRHAEALEIANDDLAEEAEIIRKG